MKKILKRACQLLAPLGQIRILVYSDKRWSQMMGREPPPIDSPISSHPRFEEWVRKNDPVGVYADWFSPEKLKIMVEEFAVVTETQYVGSEGALLGAVIVPR